MNATGVSNKGNNGLESLRAHIVKRFLPNLGSGMKLFDEPMEVAGNSKLRIKTDPNTFSVMA